MPLRPTGGATLYPTICLHSHANAPLSTRLPVLSFITMVERPKNAYVYVSWDPDLATLKPGRPVPLAAG
jgi:hypothetical protein